ncbi:MAG: helix-turn-helix domain-containing protein [Ruminococcaceae bacterium]|nr:helix-turn-helix domain-containing protein [Oscillospiraceae bacterium]
MGGKVQSYDSRQVMCRADYEIAHKRDTYLQNVALHHHDFYEVYFLVSGDVNYVIEGRNYSVLPGNMMIVSPRELHQAHIEPDMAPYERYVLWIDPKLLERLSTESTDLTRCFDISSPGYSNLLYLSSGERSMVRSLMEEILSETENTGYGAELMQSSMLTQLMILVNRIAAKGDARSDDMTYSSRVVTDVINYVNIHYGEQLSLDDLAERFFVNKYHLSHEFNRHVGTSVYRFIQKKRLQIARQLLAQGQKPKKVCSECGFSDYTCFYRAFRSEYGIAPREFALSVNRPIQDGDTT